MSIYELKILKWLPKIELYYGKNSSKKRKPRQSKSTKAIIYLSEEKNKKQNHAVNQLGVNG